MSEKSQEADHCLFCKIATGALETAFIYEDEQVVAFKDINPAAPTHLLIIPKQHISTLNDLQPEHTQLAGHLLLTAQQIAKIQGIDDSGYRVVMNCNKNGGQTVYHIHMHLLGDRILSWPPG